ncbi:hypothetical protein ACYPKM_01655 [Pseudomonas aeruginosa]
MTITNEYQALDDFASTNAHMRLGARETMLFGSLRVYSRLACRLIGGSMCWTLDLADLEIIDPADREKGNFSRFLAHAERVALDNKLALYVESIMNPHLTEILKRKGYRVTLANEEFPGIHNACLTLEDLQSRLTPRQRSFDSPSP